MARKAKTRNSFLTFSGLSGETKRAVVSILLFVATVIFVLAAAERAGVGGRALYSGISYLFGLGYYLLPILTLTVGVILVRPIERELGILKVVGALLLFLSALGLVDIFAATRGGVVGNLISSPLRNLFDLFGAVAILGALLLIAFFILFEARLMISMPGFFSRIIGLFRREKSDEPMITGYQEEEEIEEEEVAEAEDEVTEEEEVRVREPLLSPALAPSGFRARMHGTYVPPPLSLFERDKGKPGVGDIKANANIIKRTFQNFGISVEMDEVSIGPTVTRYALKPAEGVRLSKIISLQNNLELALAAHPVRIEAPIPGKSLVGIEVPNSTKATVGFSTLLSSPEFTGSDKPLLLALGRDIGGSPILSNLAKMPHVLIAGATGSGKSVTIHALVNSLIYRNSPEALRFIMIDPKRVELTLYNNIPHLLTPVITDPKKTILSLKWAAKEMDRRYNILEAESARDIDSYHKNVLAPALEKAAKSGEESTVETMPYLVIIIDELADIMQSYPRELEAAVVRLAQMSRAVGIHLILSTQRPSVNVITGLIKANVPARIALQVASQIDSRTILDGSGAEKLLGAGDMLYLSGDMGKPARLQAPYLTEGEVKKVVKYLKDNYSDLVSDEIQFSDESKGVALANAFSDDEEIDDDLYQEAKQVVEEAGKASTSYLQRKLRIGYSRAARLMDILEERGVIGPADGSKPREVIGASSGGDPEEESTKEGV